MLFKLVPILKFSNFWILKKESFESHHKNFTHPNLLI